MNFSNLLKNLVLLALSFSTISCNNSSSSGGGSSAPVVYGRCYFTKSVGTSITPVAYTCIDISSPDNASSSTNCKSLYDQFSALNGYEFLWTGATCTQATSNAKVGSCAMSLGTMYYFSQFWTQTQAQTDCTGSRQGTWTSQ